MPSMIALSRLALPVRGSVPALEPDNQPLLAARRRCQGREAPRSGRRMPILDTAEEGESDFHTAKEGESDFHTAEDCANEADNEPGAEDDEGYSADWTT